MNTRYAIIMTSRHGEQLLNGGDLYDTREEAQAAAAVLDTWDGIGIKVAEVTW